MISTYVALDGIVISTIEVVVQHAYGHASNCLPVEFFVHQLICFIQGSRVDVDNAELFS